MPFDQDRSRPGWLQFRKKRGLDDDLGLIELTQNQVLRVAAATLLLLQRRYPRASQEQLVEGMVVLHPHRQAVAETGHIDLDDLDRVHNRLTEIFGK